MRLAMIFTMLVLFLTPAHAQRAIEFAQNAGDADGIIAAIADLENLEGVTSLLSKDEAGRFERAVGATAFAGAVGETASLLLGGEVGEIHLIGIGTADLRPRDWENFGGRAGLIAKNSKAATLAVVAPGATARDAAAAAKGSMLGAYSFDKYKSESPEPVTGDLVFVLPEAETARAQFENQGRALAEAVMWARDLQSEPANALYPEEFVRRARNAFRGIDRVSINVLTVRDMERLGMGAILGVGRGSVRPPRMMIIRYNGGDAGAAPMVFAGKGITFDTGGISLKPNTRMWMMKADMTGAATVTAATLSLAKSKAPVNVIAIAALAENMPDGGAQRPGDVVKTMSGKTVEILSTDAEGRLVLSDAVWYAQQEFNPSLLVDVATLTGSVGRALGDEYAGLFSRDDAIAERLRAAGEASGEDLWRLPLHPNHNKQIKSFIADIKNSDTGAPGASTGAAFIGSFIKEETPWAHLDIAGVDWREDPAPTVPLGASGFSVRLLDQLARDGVE